VPDTPGFQDLASTLQGDLVAFARLEQQPHALLVQLATQLTNLTLGPDALLAVLESLEQQTVATPLIQRWASFVRRGYLADSSARRRQPIKPLDIPYAAEAEAQIVAVLTCLDELGDVVDGTIEPKQLHELVASLQCLAL
jgi:hypothetical protein